MLDDAPASVVATPGGTAFDITAEQPGTYRVSFSVGDGTSEVTGTARITLLADDAAAQLATAPVVAFVHPREDATVDVFAAVSNPTRRVLLLSDAVPRVDAGASLSVDIVGQNSMRVSGTTAAGDPGRLGTVSYVVSDGTADVGARVVGEATIYLLPPAPELAPIAVGDSVVVRQGAQVDIPVLTNDVAPSGSGLTLNPAAVVSSTSEGLAFASGGVLRYLAPETPGEYVVQYGVYATGAPALTDTAEVRITVQSDEANRDPLPETLEGRVLSGQTTTIPFDSFGVDPDGDAVVLDAVLSQPDAGAASISADGTSIVYSSVAGFRGQVSFRYRVVDASGATGVGTVRVGVLDGQSNPSPVTFTDYVQVQAGTQNVIEVSPLANDIDPTGGTLRLAGVQPDLPATLEDGSPSAEYERLESLVRTVDESTIAVTASSEPGTMSFLYDVESDSGNTASGLVVVRIVREAVPDYPVVADTVLTAETRDDFVRGVDVVSGKVRWTGGEISELTLSLWGAPTDLDVDGTTISGDLPLTGRIVAFELTGEGASGPVTTYGFLRIPGERDVKLALRAGASAQDVTEGRSKNIDVATLVPVPDGTSLQVSPDVAASGARPQGTCELVSGTTVRYEAGLAAPWADACYVPVRLAGTQEWSVVAIPIRVLAVAPQPQLRGGALTIAPGSPCRLRSADAHELAGARRVEPDRLRHRVHGVVVRDRGGRRSADDNGRRPCRTRYAGSDHRVDHESHGGRARAFAAAGRPGAVVAARRGNACAAVLASRRVVLCDPRRRGGRRGQRTAGHAARGRRCRGDGCVRGRDVLGRVRRNGPRRVDRGCPGRDVYGILHSARRAGTHHGRRARRCSASRSAGVSPGPDERPPGRLRRRFGDAAGRPGDRASGLSGPDRVRRPILGFGDWFRFCRREVLARWNLPEHRRAEWRRTDL